MHDLKNELRHGAASFGEPTFGLPTIGRKAQRREVGRRVAAGATAVAVVAFSGTFLVRAFGGDEPRPPASAAGVRNGAIAYATGTGCGGTAEGGRFAIVDPDTGTSVSAEGCLQSGAWSPDGSRIAFIHDPIETPPGDMSIWTMRPDGTDARKLTGGAGDYGPQWSPDGTQLLFFRNDSERGPSLMVMDAVGGNVDQVAGVGEQVIFTAVWSPDGSRILTVRDEYARTREGNPLWLAVMDADGSNEHVLVRDFLNQPQWTPDGTEILYHAHGEIRAIPTSGGSDRTVVGGVDPEGQTSFQVSPEGTSILFTRPIGPERGEELWVAGVDGSDPRLVAEGLQWRDPAPTWSPDGTAIAFVRDGDIWTIDLATDGERRVTDSPEVETSPIWGTI